MIQKGKKYQYQNGCVVQATSESFKDEYDMDIYCGIVIKEAHEKYHNDPDFNKLGERRCDWFVCTCIELQLDEDNHPLPIESFKF